MQRLEILFKMISKMEKELPNDSDLGEQVRKLIRNFNEEQEQN